LGGGLGDICCALFKETFGDVEYIWLQREEEVITQLWYLAGK
jgi:hypothetical protein